MWSSRIWYEEKETYMIRMKLITSSYSLSLQELCYKMYDRINASSVAHSWPPVMQLRERERTASRETQ